MTSDCQGTWGYERYLGETEIRVQVCSGCREIWAFEGYRDAGKYAPGTPDRDIIAAVIARLHNPFPEVSP